MKTRIIAAVALLPFLLGIVLFLPKIFTAILFGLMAAVGAYELLHNTGLVKHNRLVWYAMAMALYVSLWGTTVTVYPAVLLGLLGFFCILFGELLRNHTQVSFQDLAYTFVAGIILPYLLSAVADTWTRDWQTFDPPALCSCILVRYRCVFCRVLLW